MNTPNASEFTQYRRTQIAEMRPYVEGEALSERVSVSAADRENGSPKQGDMIARNPKNHADQWLVAAQYFADNFELLTAANGEPVADSLTAYLRSLPGSRQLTDAELAPYREEMRRNIDEMLSPKRAPTPATAGASQGQAVACKVCNGEGYGCTSCDESGIASPPNAGTDAAREPFDDFDKLLAEMERDCPREMEAARQWVREKFYPAARDAAPSDQARDAVLVPRETLKRVRNDLHSCQAVIHLARDYGFDPAYVRDAQESLKLLDAAIAAERGEKGK